MCLLLQAKNFVPGAEGKSTKVSQAVLALQEQLPKARIVYCSATGVSKCLGLTHPVSPVVVSFCKPQAWIPRVMSSCCTCATMTKPSWMLPCILCC